MDLEIDTDEAKMKRKWTRTTQEKKRKDLTLRAYRSVLMIFVHAKIGTPKHHEKHWAKVGSRCRWVGLIWGDGLVLASSMIGRSRLC